MTDDNNDDGDDGNFDDTLSEILGTSSSPDLDLAFGAVDVNVDRAYSWGAHLRSRSFHYHNHLFPHWWLSYNKLVYLSQKHLAKRNIWRELES